MEYKHVEKSFSPFDFVISFTVCKWPIPYETRIKELGQKTNLEVVSNRLFEKDVGTLQTQLRKGTLWNWQFYVYSNISYPIFFSIKSTFKGLHCS